jgi:hypothetical protein
MTVVIKFEKKRSKALEEDTKNAKRGCVGLKCPGYIRYLSGDGGEKVIGDTGEYSPPATASSSENGGSEGEVEIRSTDGGCSGG